MSKGVIERQVIVSWYTLAEKLPPEDNTVIATITGKSKNATYDHALVFLAWCKDEGWYSLEDDFEELQVLAWCDLEPYGW